MKYEFKINGNSDQLTLIPDTNFERELFSHLFSGNVEVAPAVSSNGNGEIVITKKSKEPAKEPVPPELSVA